MAREVVASPLARFAVELGSGAGLELRAREPQGGVVPVLHLWDEREGREVARAAGGRWFGREPQLRYRNPHRELRRYQLLVRSRDPGPGGEVLLWRDGQRWQRAAVGGMFLSLATGPGYLHQAAAVPGGLHSALLLALDDDGRVRALDERSGPTGLPRLGESAGGQRLVIGSLEGKPGRVSVYTNDARDGDGDGLGRKLERALGSCDGPNEPGCRVSALAAYYRARPEATRDSDRDGVSDADELFGVQAPALDLPRFGADLRHKDVFIEVDHHPSLPDVGLLESELAQIAALYAQGSARALRNPDGLPGLRLHFDVGSSPRERAHLALFGDFGGSGATRALEYRAARHGDFTPSRNGYFRYAFTTRAGRGQAMGDAFTVNRDLQRVTIFAHELGHTLGLAHHGHDRWGRVNCKPNYYSIMNYLYQNRYEIGFARAATTSLNPAGVVERNTWRAGSAALLREPPLELDVRGRDVDWNRDGLFSDEPVRAGLTWASYKSCGAAESGSRQLATGDLAPATPVLLRVGSQLLAFWLDGAGRVWFRSGVTSGTLPGCAGGAADGCSDWSEAKLLEGFTGLRQLAVYALRDTRLAVAGVREDGTLVLGWLTLGETSLWLVDVARFGLRTDQVPSFVIAQVDERYYGVARLLLLLLRERSSGELWQLAFDPEGRELDARVAPRKLADVAGRPIVSATAPSALALPTGELCGVFSDAQAYLRFYCYQRARDVWEDLSTRAFDVGLGPRTAGSVGMAFHRYRAADGAAVGGDETRGALYLSFTETESRTDRYPDNPHYLFSEWLTARHGAFEQISLRWRGVVGTEWTTLAPGTGVALYEDETLQALKALMLVKGPNGALHLDFLPFADASYPEPLGSGNDFEVMERGVCAGLRGDACGDASTAAY